MVLTYGIDIEAELVGELGLLDDLPQPLTGRDAGSVISANVVSPSSITPPEALSTNCLDSPDTKLTR